MKITVIIQEKKLTKSSYFFDGIKEFEKRLSRFCKLNIIYTKNDKECLKYIKNSSKVYIVTNTEKTITSPEFSKLIKNLGLNSNVYSDTIFIINNPELNIENSDNFTISKTNLSPHMTTITLVEQIYRAYKIINNENYHK